MIENKSTVDEIRARFDNDVERFSNLEMGQSATIDAPLVLELVTRVAAAATPGATRLLDIGCGAGNYTLKMLQHLPGLDVTLIDLSQPMLTRAGARIGAVSSGAVTTLQGDIRQIELGEAQFDIILAAAVFHHLRGDEDWEQVFSKCFRALRPGGGLWISDMVEHAITPAREVMWQRYGEYLTSLKDDAYRQHVFSYIEKEDTPRPLTYQLDLLRKVGFAEIELLHKNSIFAAFGGIKR